MRCVQKGHVLVNLEKCKSHSSLQQVLIGGLEITLEKAYQCNYMDVPKY